MQERIARLPKLPVFWNLSGRRAIVAGGTDGAAWKAELLHACGANVEVYCRAEELGDLMKALVAEGLVSFPGIPWSSGIFGDCVLALADSESDEEAAAFFQAARNAGVPVNVIDRPAFCEFQFGSIVNRAPVIVAISTDGAAPILAQAIRQRIEAVLPLSLKQWAALGKALRQVVKQRLAAGASRRLFWEAFAEHSLATSDPPAADTATQMIEAMEEIGTITIPGSVLFVGAGPGDAELLTLKAVRALQSADVVLYDEPISTQVLDLARREARRIFVQKKDGREASMQDGMMDLMLGYARDGKRIVRLKKGNPGRFERTAKEIKGLRSEGIAVDIIPGVASSLTSPPAVCPLRSLLAGEKGAALHHMDAINAVGAGASTRASLPGPTTSSY